MHRIVVTVKDAGTDDGGPSWCLRSVRPAMSLPFLHAPGKPIIFTPTRHQYLGSVIMEWPKLSAENGRRVRMGWMEKEDLQPPYSVARSEGRGDLGPFYTDARRGPR